MSRVDATILILRHHFAVTYDGKGGEHFARNGTTSVAMSGALDAVGDYLEGDAGPSQVERDRASGKPLPEAVVAGMRTLGEMSDMPTLHEDYREHAEEVFWRQLGVVAWHRSRAAENPSPRM